MTTHCSPRSGATTQQFVSHGPAGNPTTSTNVLSGGFQVRLATALLDSARLFHQSIPEAFVATSRRRERELARRRFERRRQAELERRARAKRRNTVLGASIGTVAVIALLVVLGIVFFGGS